MKTLKSNISIFIAVLVFPFALLAQEQQEQKDSTAVPSKSKFERPAFESSALIENQTNVLYKKGTLEMTMNHRFGLVNGSNDMIGIWAPANIRIALTYAVCDRITVGFGTTKDNRLQDFSLKGAILRQTRSGGKIPLSISYYGNFAYDARPPEFFTNNTDRYSFFNQLIFARRFNSKLSILFSPSLSHSNNVETTMKNDMFAFALGGRYKITDVASVIVDYSQPLTQIDQKNPKPGFGIGFEYSTGSHIFQLFATNYRGIVPQQSYVFNQNDFFNGDFVIGFNITRLWHM